MPEERNSEIEKRALPPAAIFRREMGKLSRYILIAYLVLFALMYSPLYTSIVLKPDHNDDELYKLDKIQDASREEYFFESKGKQLYGWLFRKPGSKILVLVHHGNAGNILNRVFLAKAFVESGASVFLYDYRGYGKSAGEASLDGLAEDGLAAFDFARSKFQFPKLINYGESIGSGVACRVDSQRKADALILQSGISSLPEVARAGVVFFYLYPDAVWPQPSFDNRLLLARSQTPLLLIHGDRDKLVPESHSERLLAAAAAKDKLLVRLPNCGHNDVGVNDAAEFQSAINSFIRKQEATSN